MVKPPDTSEQANSTTCRAYMNLNMKAENDERKDKELQERKEKAERVRNLKKSADCFLSESAIKFHAVGWE